METKIYNREGKAIGQTTLKAEVFSAAAHPGTINDVVKAQRNNERQGTVMTKTRSYVAGGGRKPWRQKGTGRARQGSTRSPLWPGGACTFGPLPRIYDHRPPKKMVDVALRGALTDKAKHNQVRVFDALAFDTGHAKDFRAFLAANKLTTVLVVVPEITENLARATRNFKTVKVTTPLHVSAYDLLRFETVAMTEKAKSALEEVLS